MKHLIICREYPPAPGGGIGTYVLHLSRLLAEGGETVHVIGQLWEGAEKEVEEKCHGRLIIHRVPFEDWTSFLGPKPNPAIKSRKARDLFNSSFHPQSFSWQASLLAEKLISQEGIDIIEAQEFEAPLYYLQLRRALGIGPKKKPPCVVHLHSPTEFIARHNDWDIGLPAVITAKRLEDYSISASDALLCPSRYLAYQIEDYYKLVRDTIKVIPYPIGNTPMLERDKDTWRDGTICYVGRLERRKGVIEWIDAAVAIAEEYPTSNFNFVGSDILDNHGESIQELMQQRIPKELRKRFHFCGEQNSSSLAQFLTKARIAVVPSRWDNFPYTCIEAMCSGLPVIVSSEGGMVDMIEDGRTGWVARKMGSDGLRGALKRALDTPSMNIAEMGIRASSDIHQMCDNNKIVEKQLDFRSQIVNQGSKHSLNIPANLSWTKRFPSNWQMSRTTQNNSQEGIAIVVTCFNNRHLLNECLQSLEQQTRKPAAVVVLGDESTKWQTLNALKQISRNGWKAIQNVNANQILVKNEGIEAVLSSGINPIGFSFLDAEHRLQPGFVASCERVLQKCQEVGLISCWAYQSNGDNKILCSPCPSFPYQWLSNDAVPYSVVRTEALLDAGNFRPEMCHGYENWDLFNAVMAAGWSAVTIPEILGNHLVQEMTTPHITNDLSFRKIRRKLLERFPDIIARDGRDIVLLTESMITQSQRKAFIALKQHLTKARMLLRYPGKTSSQVIGKVRNKILMHTSV